MPASSAWVSGWWPLRSSSGRDVGEAEDQDRDRDEADSSSMIAESQSATMVMPKGAGQPPACSAKGPLRRDLREDRAPPTASSAERAGEREAALHRGRAPGQQAEHRGGERDDERPEQQHQPWSSTGSAARMSSISVVPKDVVGAVGQREREDQEPEADDDRGQDQRLRQGVGGAGDGLGAAGHQRRRPKVSRPEAKISRLAAFEIIVSPKR